MSRATPPQIIDSLRGDDVYDDRRVQVVRVYLRYWYRDLYVGQQLQLNTDGSRRLSVDGFTPDGVYANVRRSTSRRKQRIKCTELARRYRPANGWANWPIPKAASS